MLRQLWRSVSGVLGAPHVVLVGGIIVAPLLTWLPALKMKYPSAPIPLFQVAEGVDAWQMQVLYFVIVMVVAAAAWPTSPFLSIGLTVPALHLLNYGATGNVASTMLVTLGSAALLVLWRTPQAAHQPIRWTLAACGAFQAAYAIQQSVYQVDVLWGPWSGLIPSAVIQPLGTLGRVDALAAFVAITAPLMPWWWLALAIPAVVLTKSITGCLALSIGLLVHYRGQRWLYPAFGAIGSATTWYVYTHKPLDTVYSRLLILDFGLSHWWRTAPWFGLGLGGWYDYIPGWQMKTLWSPGTHQFWIEYFREAHCDPAQWLVETGIIGGVALLGFLWWHRRAFGHPVWGGSLSAGLVASCGFFPFHVVSLALLLIVVFGLAWSPTA